MEKLTIKELAPYLPYGLKFIYTGSTMEPDLEREIVIIGPYFVRCPENPLCIYHFNEIKPLLIPLSELTEEFIRQFDWAYTDNVINHCKSGAIDVKTWNALVEYHFDVFGLIDKGLAITKTTKQNDTNHRKNR